LNPQLQADRAYKRTKKYYKMFTNLSIEYVKYRKISNR
jgi:hypothetical protein